MHRQPAETSRTTASTIMITVQMRQDVALDVQRRIRADRFRPVVVAHVHVPGGQRGHGDEAQRHEGHPRVLRPALLIRIVVPTASATLASSWLATPNIGQIVSMLPVQMK